MLTAFLGMDGREEELIDEASVVEDRRMVLGLEPAHYPKTPFFGFFEGVEPAGKSTEKIVIVNNLDGTIGGSLAAMDHLRL